MIAEGDEAAALLQLLLVGLRELERRPSKSQTKEPVRKYQVLIYVHTVSHKTVTTYTAYSSRV